MQSDKKTTLLNRPIQHLYQLEASIATNLNPCATDQASVANNEDHDNKAELMHTTPTEDEELFGRNGGTRSRPQRIPAQVARHRLKKLTRDPYWPAVSKFKGEYQTFALIMTDFNM